MEAVLKINPEASKWEIRHKVWDYMEAKNLANFPRPVHNRIPNFKGAERACAHVSNLEIFHRTSEVKVGPDKPLQGVRLAVLQAGKTLLVPTPRLRTGLFNKIVPPLGASRKDLRVCSTSQGVKEFSVPIGLDAKMTVDLVVVGSVAVSEKGYRIGKGEGYADMEYAMMVSVGAVKDPLVVSVVHDCQVMDIPEGLIESHDLTVDYILTPTRVIKTECKHPKPQGIIWTKLTPAMLEKIPILKKLRSLEQQAGKDVTLGGASAGREAEAEGDFVLSISADGVFVPKVTEGLGKMNLRNVPWIIGTTNHEFGWLLSHGFPENAQEIIEEEYFGDTARVRDILLDLLGDLLFVSPSVKAARVHRDAGSPVFFYEFQQRPSVYGHGRPDFVKVDHFDDVGFVFGAPFWTEEIVTLEASKCEIRQKVWDYMETMNLANFPRPVHNRIPNFKGAERACAHVSNLEIFHRTSEVKVDPDKPLEGARLAVLQAGKTLLVPTPRLRTGLLNKIVPPQGAGREDLRVCSTSQGVKDFSVPIGLDAKMTVELLVVGSVAVSEKGYRIGKGEGYSDMEYAMMVSVGAVKDPLVVSVVHDCQIMDIPEGLIESHDLTVDYILTPTRVIKTECKRPKPQGIIWTKLTPAMLEKIPILKKLRSLEQQAGKDVTLGGASAGREAEAVGRGPDGEDRAPERGVTTSVFLGGLPPGLRVSELKSALRERGAGPLRLNWQGAQRRAFLDYSDRPAAEAALHALQGLSINGKSVQVELARSQRGGGKKGGPARDRAQTGPGPETRTVT